YVVGGANCPALLGSFTLSVQIGGGIGNSATSVLAVPTIGPDCSQMGRGANLAGCSFARVSFSGDLSGANLASATIADSSISALMFGANLASATLTRVGLAYAALVGANLSSAYLVGDTRMDLQNANFQSANMTGVVIGPDTPGVIINAQ